MSESKFMAAPMALSLIICVSESSVANADTATTPETSAAAAAPSGSLQEVTVTAQKLNEARAGIQTQTGAST